MATILVGNTQPAIGDTLTVSSVTLIFGVMDTYAIPIPDPYSAEAMASSINDALLTCASDTGVTPTLNGAMVTLTGAEEPTLTTTSVHLALD